MPITNTIIATVTAYCVCTKCCGKSDGITASGARVQTGITAAQNGVPFGTVLQIEKVPGQRSGYPLVLVVQDRMARRFDSSHIDLYFPNHAEALQFGKRKLRVTIITP